MLFWRDGFLAFGFLRLVFLWACDFLGDGSSAIGAR